MTLSHKINKNLLAEMTRIWPEFEPKGEYYFSVNKINNKKQLVLQHLHPDFFSHVINSDCGYPSKGTIESVEQCAALTPADLIRFLQTFPGSYVAMRKVFINELIYIHKIFLNPENFETGAVWLLKQLKKLKIINEANSNLFS